MEMSKAKVYYIISAILSIIIAIGVFLSKSKLPDKIMSAGELYSIIIILGITIIEIIKIMKNYQNKALKLASQVFVICIIIPSLVLLSSLDRFNLSNLGEVVLLMAIGIGGIIFAYISNIIGFFMKKE